MVADDIGAAELGHKAVANIKRVIDVGSLLVGAKLSRVSLFSYLAGAIDECLTEENHEKI